MQFLIEGDHYNCKSIQMHFMQKKIKSSYASNVEFPIYERGDSGSQHMYLSCYLRAYHSDSEDAKTTANMNKNNVAQMRSRDF